MNSPLERLRALIVDDEPLGRESVRELLEHIREIEIIGECEDGHQAVREIKSKRPDLVFLDVQMPGMDGFGVIGKIHGEHLPLVVFVTAYDEFAVRAFEVHALDYLLKPIDPDRFQVAIDHALEAHRRKDLLHLDRELRGLLEDVRNRSRKYVEQIAVKSHTKIVLVAVKEIEWVEAEGDYVCVHAAGKKHLLREKISSLEEKLDPRQFVRIHRSTIVNIGTINNVERSFSGDYVLTLHNGTKLTVSRSYRSSLFALLNLNP